MEVLLTTTTRCMMMIRSVEGVPRSRDHVLKAAKVVVGVPAGARAAVIARVPEALEARAGAGVAAVIRRRRLRMKEWFRRNRRLLRRLLGMNK